MKSEHKELYERGIQLFKENKWVEAIAVFTQIIDLDSIAEKEKAPSYFQRGNAYKMKKDYHNAIADYGKAIGLQPYAEAYYNRGVVYYEQSEYPRAMEDFGEAIRLDPDYTNAYNNRGNVYTLQGKYAAAIADFDKAIELYPSGKSANHNRAVAMTLQQSKGMGEALNDEKPIRDREVTTVPQQSKGMGGTLNTPELEKANKKIFWMFVALVVYSAVIFVSIGGGYLWVLDGYIGGGGEIEFSDVSEAFNPYVLLPYIFMGVLMLSPVAWALRFLIQDKKERQGKALTDLDDPEERNKLRDQYMSSSNGSDSMFKGIVPLIRLVVQPSGIAT